MGLAAFVLLVAGAGYVYVHHLDSNIQHGALDAGTAPQKGRTIPGVLNILVIGSDTRNSALDTKLGGADNSLPHADVEMLVHVSADHKNATVLSIPRDTDIAMPSCTQNGRTYPGAAHAQITNSLNHGAGCTVAAVNALTKVPITHYMVVDFSGVVNMSDAVGGVSVCVDHNVYDPASHLKLSQGTHVLKGQAALEFLRTRHGFGDGGDIGRTVAQHVFLSAMIRKLKSASTLTNPSDVFGLAEAASHAFRVDDGLAGVTKLVSLANSLAQVPTDHIDFVTMPSAQDPYNPKAWVVPGPGATQLFQAIANDQPLTPAKSSNSGKSSGSAKSGASASATAGPSISPASVPIHILNGAYVNGTAVPGLAGRVQQRLAGDGYSDTVKGDTSAVGSTRIQYSTADPRYQQEARQVAAALGLPSSALDPKGTHHSLYLLLGPDARSLANGSGTPSGKPSVDIKAATAQAHTENAASGKSCAKTNSYPLGGLPPDLAAWNGLSVEEAYAIAQRKHIPDSDK